MTDHINETAPDALEPTGNGTQNVAHDPAPTDGRGDPDVDAVTPTGAKIADDSGDSAANAVEPTDGDVASSAPESATAGQSGERSQLLLGPSPTIDGENPAEFERLLAALRADYPCNGGGGVLHEWLIETAALKMLTARRGTRAERGAWQAALADSLLRRLVDHAALNELRREDSAELTQKDEAIEQAMTQRFWRAQQQTSWAAVAGDSVALEQIEKNLGAGALEIDRAVDFGALYEVLARIDRVVRPANADGAAAFRQLEKRKKRAEKKRRVDQATAPTRGREAIDLGTSERATPSERTTTATNAPTVIAPKSTGGGNGGAR
jgi:hypothetical protein